MRSFSVGLLAFFFSGLAVCADYPEASAPAQPDHIIVRRFAAPRRVVTLDPSLSFSLHRGQRGVPPARRADSVARATAFILADTITQQLRELGFEAIQSDEAGPGPGGRALIIHGVFRRINEGHRRRFAAQDASVAVAVEIKLQSYDANPRRLTAIQLDSLQIPDQSGAHRETGVSSSATRLGVAIANIVSDFAHGENWRARRSGGG